jgi:hypothetical protein
MWLPSAGMTYLSFVRDTQPGPYHGCSGLLGTALPYSYSPLTNTQG